MFCVLLTVGSSRLSVGCLPLFFLSLTLFFCISLLHNLIRNSNFKKLRERERKRERQRERERERERERDALCVRCCCASHIEIALIEAQHNLLTAPLLPTLLPFSATCIACLASWSNTYIHRHRHGPDIDAAQDTERERERQRHTEREREMFDESESKRRKVVIADDEEEADAEAMETGSQGSNPDEDFEDGEALEEEVEGEDLMEDIYKLVAVRDRPYLCLYLFLSACLYLCPSLTGCMCCIPLTFSMRCIKLLTEIMWQYQN